MARVTVEDCIEKVPNRFEIISIAARRARDITLGEPPKVDREKDKDAVVALREIADGKLDLDDLRRSIVESMQRFRPVSETEEETEVAPLNLPQEDQYLSPKD